MMYTSVRYGKVVVAGVVALTGEVYAETAPSLNARTRYQYVVVGLALRSANAATFAPTVPTPTNAPGTPALFGARSMLNPASFVALSVHCRSMRDLVDAWAV